MRLFKLITGGLLAAIVGLFVYQNLAVFKQTVSFSLDLYIHEQVSWSHSIYGLIAISAATGLLVGFVLLLKPYLNLRRRLTHETHEKEIAKEKCPENVAAPSPQAPPPPPTESPGPAA